MAKSTLVFLGGSEWSVDDPNDLKVLDWGVEITMPGRAEGDHPVVQHVPWHQIERVTTPAAT